MKVKICCIAFERNCTTDEDVIDQTIEQIDRVAWDNPDIICLPECFAQYHLSNKDWSSFTPERQNKIVTTIAQRARDFNCHIICPLILKAAGRLINSAVLIDSNGCILGQYDKIHPTLHELAVGVCPGERVGIFETKLGKIGILLCFDLNYRQVVDQFMGKDIKIIFFPSMFEGGLMLRHLALSTETYVASATIDSASQIINPLGRIIKYSSMHELRIIETIETDFKVCHIDLNKERLDGVKEKYGSAIEIQVASAEARYLISAGSPEIELDKVFAEFGLETYQSYLLRSCQKKTV